MFYVGFIIDRNDSLSAKVLNVERTTRWWTGDSKILVRKYIRTLKMRLT